MAENVATYGKPASKKYNKSEVEMRNPCLPEPVTDEF